MAELRHEVQQLRNDLVAAKAGSQEAQGGGLLAYIQSIGRDHIGDLTASISEVAPSPRCICAHPSCPETSLSRAQDVLEAMRLLIEKILSEAGAWVGKARLSQ